MLRDRSLKLDGFSKQRPSFGCTILIAWHCCGWWRGLQHVCRCVGRRVRGTGLRPIVARSVLLSGPLSAHFNEKRSARCRQLTTTGQQALDDAASSGLHAGTKSPEVLTAGRAEFSALRLRCSKLHKRLLRRSRTARLRKRCRHAKKRCHDEKRPSDAVCHLRMLPRAPADIRVPLFSNKSFTLNFGFFGCPLRRHLSQRNGSTGVRGPGQTQIRNGFFETPRHRDASQRAARVGETTLAPFAQRRTLRGTEPRIRPHASRDHARNTPPHQMLLRDRP